MPITEPIDEDELEADLAALEQENLDEKMLKTGTVPVADGLSRMPKAANGESEYFPFSTMIKHFADMPCSQRENESPCGGRRRRRGAAEVAG